MTDREEFEKYVALKYGDAYENLLGLRDDGEYRNGLMRDLWPAWQAARATADHIGEATEKVSATADHRDSVIEECAKVVDGYADRALDCDPQFALDLCSDAVRALKSQQDAAVESQRSGDGS